jgi:hypothetical protein
MTFKEAFELVYEIHKQTGDRDAWAQARERLKNDTEKCKSFKEWQSKMHTRSDISDDERWDFDCIDSSVEVLFALIYPQPAQEQK